MTPEKMIPIDATIGSETTRTSSCSLYLFWIPRAHEKTVKPEIGMDTACKTMPQLRKEWEKRVNAMLDDPSPNGEEGGRWTDARYTVEEGTTLKLWGEKTAWGVAAGKAAVVLYCSKLAPVNRLTVQLSGNANASKQTATITGQFFIINRDNVEEHPIPALTSQCLHYATPMNIQEVFYVEEMIPAPEQAMGKKIAVAQADDVTNHEGGAVVIHTKARKRRLG